jgi:hypothetical protein
MKLLYRLLAATIAATFWVITPIDAAQAGHNSVFLFSGETLLPGQYLRNTSAPGYRLIMQLDGNLVLYERPGTSRQRACAWSNTTRWPGSHAWMSPDGYFAVFEPHGGVVWTTRPGTERKNINRLDRAEVVLYANGDARVVSRQSSSEYFEFWHC